MTYKTDAQTPI